MIKFDVKIFSRQDDILGEGVLWHPKRNSLFWLDIISCKLFEKKLSSISLSFDNVWSLPEICSTIALAKNEVDSLFMVTDKSIGKFTLNNGEYHEILKLPYSSCMRTNDGGIGPDGSYWFGSMEKTPLSKVGSIYSFNKFGQLKNHYHGIGIPNTFCWNKDKTSFFISDSLEQVVYKFYWGNDGANFERFSLTADYRKKKGTPDGGAIDQNNCFWNAIWGGSKVRCLNNQREVIIDVELPVLQPSNCCFGGKDNNILFITSAREGLSDKELEAYPLSGSVFMITLNVSGLEVESFALN